MNGLNESKSYWARKLFGRDAKAKTVTSEAPSRTNDGLATATLGRPSVGSKATVLLFQARADGNGGTAVLAIDGNTDDDGNVISTTADVNVALTEGQRVSVIRSGRDLTVIPDGDVVAATAEPIATDAATSVVAQTVGQYFWHDTQGVHVSNAKPITSGTKNIIVNSSGVGLYNGTTELASFVPGTIQLGSSANTASSIIFNGDGTSFGTSITYNPSTASNSPTHTNNRLYKVTRFHTMEAEAILESVDTSGTRAAMLYLDAANPSSGTATDEAVSSTLSASRTYAQTASFSSGVSCTAGGSGATNGVATIDIKATASAVSGVTVAPSSINMTADQMTFNSSPIHVAATSTNSSSKTLTSSYATIPLATIESSDTNHLARVGSLNTYGINIVTAGKVLISASLYATGVTASDNIGIEITAGNTVIKGPFALQTGSGGIGIVTIPPFLYTATAGTYIYLRAKTSAGGGTVAAGDAYMTVQYI